MDGAAFEQQSFGQRGLAGVGMGNDRERPPTRMVDRDGQNFLLGWAAFYGKPDVGNLPPNVEGESDIAVNGSTKEGAPP
jgi:hypothetical protein